MIEEAGATTETAKSLGIGASTLRKYAAALENRDIASNGLRINPDCSNPMISSALNV